MKSDQKRRAIQIVATLQTRGATVSVEPIISLLQELIDAEQAAQHPDDIAVDRFACAMKAKMAEGRNKGRYGWDDASVCDSTTLQMFLQQAVWKGDPVDVGNFAMMLFCRGEPSTEAQQPTQEDLQSMREDLNDARNGWEQATLELNEAATCIANQCATISRLQLIEAAARNLANVKGRHHSELAMNQLMKALQPAPAACQTRINAG